MAATRRSQRPQRTLLVESLERRELLASISLSGTTLTIRGDSWNNDARVDLSGSKVKVQVVSTPRVGFVLTPDVVRKEFSASQVKKINFYGYDGDDRFVNNLKNVPSFADGGNHNDYLQGGGAADQLYGGAGDDTLLGNGGADILYGDAGNDYLYGNDGNDTLYGGAGDDYLYGGNHNDDLYGDAGRDKLYGEAGLDGLYGGVDEDALYGGAGADRFLVMYGSKEHKDAASADAVVTFKNGDKAWTESNIETVDQALRLLHHKTGNDNLLELSNGRGITFERHKGAALSTTLADNNSAGRIRMFDKAFATNDLAILTTIHEIAHNWDTEHSAWNSWLKLSGWAASKPTANASKYQKSTDGEWWHLKDATFTRTYGKTTPREDFATAWESYFVYKHGVKNSAGVSKLSSDKVKHLDAFFAKLA